jgi:hypothetical protein
MTTATQSAAIQAAPTSIAGAMQALQAKYPPLQAVTRPNLKTEEAAHYLNRRPQTLRAWAMRDGIEGLRPRRIAGLLAWSTAEVKALAGVTA